jgi:hypothetical protein
MDRETDVAPERDEKHRISRRSMLLAAGIVAGGAVIGATITESLRGAGDSSITLLDALPTTALGQVQATLAPASAIALIDDAQRCREPLAHVLILHSPGTPGGVISIRSGVYQSPAFSLTSTPTMIALPFPAPYQAGKGTLIIEGEARDLIIALTPRQIISVSGSWVIPVRWTPVSACR